MRLIDADELVKSIPETHVDMFENCRNCRLLDDFQVVEIIKEAPTVDPVKHGHWEYDKDFFYPPKCSVCATAVKTPGYIGDEAFYQKYFKCCPNCGAKLDEEDDF